MHEKIKRHNCELCKSEFYNITDLKRHRKRIHEKLKNHKCDLCDYASIEAIDVTYHMARVHKNERIKDQHCDKCG